MQRESFVTLVTDDKYCVGAMVLSASLRQVQTQKELTVIYTQNISDHMKDILRLFFDNVIAVELILPDNLEGVVNPSRPDLINTFTKLHIWNLIDIKKVVFLDADILVLHNIDELFDRQELSAAPDPLWPDCFNTGVMILHPNTETYKNLLLAMRKFASFDGREQGLLNMYFKNWSSGGIAHRLSCKYNCICRISINDTCQFYTCKPAWAKYGGSVKVVHFSGPTKPWQLTHLAESCSKLAHLAFATNEQGRRSAPLLAGMLAYWWFLFLTIVRPHFSSDMHLHKRLSQELCENKCDSVITRIGHLMPEIETASYDAKQTITPSYGPHEAMIRNVASTTTTTTNDSNIVVPFVELPHHPEFHDVKWDDLHSRQRYDEDDRFSEQHHTFINSDVITTKALTSLSLSGIDYSSEVKCRNYESMSTNPVINQSSIERSEVIVNAKPKKSTSFNKLNTVHGDTAETPLSNVDIELSVKNNSLIQPINDSNRPKCQEDVSREEQPIVTHPCNERHNKSYETINQTHLVNSHTISLAEKHTFKQMPSSNIKYRNKRLVTRRFTTKSDPTELWHPDYLVNKSSIMPVESPKRSISSHPRTRHPIKSQMGLSYAYRGIDLAISELYSSCHRSGKSKLESVECVSWGGKWSHEMANRTRSSSLVNKREAFASISNSSVCNRKTAAVETINAPLQDAKSNNGLAKKHHALNTLEGNALSIKPGLAGELKDLNVNGDLCKQHSELATDDIERMYAWERGEIDYTGTDRFENIFKKLCSTISGNNSNSCNQ